MSFSLPSSSSLAPDSLDYWESLETLSCLTVCETESSNAHGPTQILSCQETTFAPVPDIAAWKHKWWAEVPPPTNALSAPTPKTPTTEKDESSTESDSDSRPQPISVDNEDGDSSVILPTLERAEATHVSELADQSDSKAQLSDPTTNMPLRSPVTASSAETRAIIATPPQDTPDSEIQCARMHDFKRSKSTVWLPSDTCSQLAGTFSQLKGESYDKASRCNVGMPSNDNNDSLQLDESSFDSQQMSVGASLAPSVFQ